MGNNDTVVMGDDTEISNRNDGISIKETQSGNYQHKSEPLQAYSNEEKLEEMGKTTEEPDNIYISYESPSEQEDSEKESDKKLTTKCEITGDNDTDKVLGQSLPAEGMPTDRMDTISSLLDSIEAMREKQNENSRRLRDMHRDYHNGFANIISNMQSELDEHRRRTKHELLKPFIKFLAELYSNNIDILTLDQGVKREMRIVELFQDILDYLEQHNVSTHLSTENEQYSKRYCKVVGKIETADANAHGKVAESRCIGFYIDNDVLVPERVRIYVKTQTATSENTGGKNPEPINESKIETIDDSISAT